LLYDGSDQIIRRVNLLNGQSQTIANLSGVPAITGIAVYVPEPASIALLVVGANKLLAKWHLGVEL
jgi:hypothetical protein